MRSTGIVRKVDELGRIVLPIELRKTMMINDRDALEIFTNEDTVILKKYIPSDIFTGDMEDLVQYKGLKVSLNSIKELARIAGYSLVKNAVDGE
jgi:transcriptional pleiotropic regulator of transition state genes